VFVDVQLPGETPVDAALAALEKACGGLRADASWSAALVDGPRVLGVESLALAGATLRLQARTAPTRQYDVARELRRRILSEFERQGIALSDVQRVALVGSGQVSESVADHVSKE
jgi:small-conductance mechanosensitive channel